LGGGVYPPFFIIRKIGERGPSDLLPPHKKKKKKNSVGSIINTKNNTNKTYHWTPGGPRLKKIIENVHE